MCTHTYSYTHVYVLALKGCTLCFMVPLYSYCSQAKWWPSSFSCIPTCKLINLYYYYSCIIINFIIIIICTFSPLTGGIIWHILGSLCTMTTYQGVQQHNVNKYLTGKIWQIWEFMHDQWYKANVCPLKTFSMFTYKISSENNMHICLWFYNWFNVILPCTCIAFCTVKTTHYNRYLLNFQEQRIYTHCYHP
jgi:hypothetical protein